MKRAFGRSWSRRLVVGLSRSSVGEEFGEVEVHAVGLEGLAESALVLWIQVCSTIHRLLYLVTATRPPFYW